MKAATCQSPLRPPAWPVPESPNEERAMARSGFYLLLSVRCCALVSLGALPRSGRKRSPSRSRRLPAVSSSGDENFSGCLHLCLTDTLEEGGYRKEKDGGSGIDGSLPISLAHLGAR